MRKAMLFILLPGVLGYDLLSPARLWLARAQETVTDLIYNPRQISTIPQFILDRSHPWILAHQHQLERLPDPASYLCSFDKTTPAQTERLALTEGLEIPADLFHKLQVNNMINSRPGWSDALMRLGEMQDCPRALEEVKEFSVELYIATNFKILELPEPPEKLLKLFGDVLESMKHLEKLTWIIRKEYMHFFKEAFENRKLVLPFVKHLEHETHGEFLVKMCPNLESLRKSHRYGYSNPDLPGVRDWRVKFIEAAAATDGLKRFAMNPGHSGWTPELIDVIVKAMPQLESLELEGTIGLNKRSMGDYEPTEDLQEVLKALRGLKNLKHLKLPDAAGLGLGYDGGHWCGNAYDGMSGMMYSRSLDKEAAETAEKAGNMVMETLPNLTHFSVGHSKPNITRIDGEGPEVTWPWSGNMTKYLDDLYPDIVGLTYANITDES